jgi:hypothetical protein
MARSCAKLRPVKSGRTIAWLVPFGVALGLVSLVAIFGSVGSHLLWRSLLVDGFVIAIAGYLLHRARLLTPTISTLALSTVLLSWVWCLNSLPLQPDPTIPDQAWYGAAVVLRDSAGEPMDVDGRIGITEGFIGWHVGSETDNVEFVGGVKLQAGESISIYMPGTGAITRDQSVYWSPSIDDWQPLPSAAVTAGVTGGGEQLRSVGWAFVAPRRWRSPIDVTFDVYLRVPSWATRLPIGKSEYALSLRTDLPMRTVATASSPLTMRESSVGVRQGRESVLFPLVDGTRYVAFQTDNNLFGYVADVAGGLVASVSGFLLGAIVSTRESYSAPTKRQPVGAGRRSRSLVRQPDIMPRLRSTRGRRHGKSSN